MYNLNSNALKYGNAVLYVMYIKKIYPQKIVLKWVDRRKKILKSWPPMYSTPKLKLYTTNTALDKKKKEENTCKQL